MAGIKMNLANTIIELLEGKDVASCLAAVAIALVGIAYKYGVSRAVLLETVGELYDKRAARGAN